MRNTYLLQYFPQADKVVGLPATSLYSKFKGLLRYMKHHQKDQFTYNMHLTFWKKDVRSSFDNTQKFVIKANEKIKCVIKSKILFKTKRRQKEKKNPGEGKLKEK